MRHRMTTKKLNRPVGPRKALVKNLLTQLYMNEAIVTTHAKAKTVQPIAEHLIHMAKPRTLGVRRHIGQLITDQVILKKLVDTIAPRYYHVSSGFTRVIKMGQRRGDNTMMSRLELVQGKEIPIDEPKPAKVSPVLTEGKDEAVVVSGKKNSKKETKAAKS